MDIVDYSNILDWCSETWLHLSWQHIDHVQPKVWPAAKLEQLFNFYCVSEGKSIGRSKGKIVVTKKITATHKYVVYLCMEIYIL